MYPAINQFSRNIINLHEKLRCYNCDALIFDYANCHDIARQWILQGREIQKTLSSHQKNAESE